MDGKTILSKVTKTGKAMYIQTEDGSRVVVYVDGKIELRWTGIPCRMPKSPTGMPEITHHLGGKIGITAAEAAQVVRAMATIRDEWYQTHPVEVPVYSLREQRRNLVADMTGAWEDGEREYWKAHAAERLDCHAIKARYDAEAEVARQKLAEFDAAHPEIIAQIKVEKAEDAERFARTN